jgi:hypothetical protein
MLAFKTTIEIAKCLFIVIGGLTVLFLAVCLLVKFGYIAVPVGILAFFTWLVYDARN